MFDTIKHIARLVFSDQIRLRRTKGRGLQLALTKAGTREFTPSEISREEAAQAEAALTLRMLDELTQVLAASASVRGSSPHLVQLHRALRDQGLVLLKAMPLPVLSRALAEFEEAVSNWSPVGLATLRSRVAVAVAERRRAGEEEALRAQPPVQHQDVPRTTAPEVTELHGVDGSAEVALRAAYGAAAGEPREAAEKLPG